MKPFTKLKPKVFINVQTMTFNLFKLTTHVYFYDCFFPIPPQPLNVNLKFKAVKYGFDENSVFLIFNDKNKNN